MIYTSSGFSFMLQSICVHFEWSLKMCLNIIILVAFHHVAQFFLKEKLGEHCYSSVSHEMCFVSYTLCSACGHVSACRSGLFAKVMFLDMVKWNTRLNSISMLKSWVWCHWKGQNSKGCGLARFCSLVGLKFLIDWWLKCYDYCFMLSQYCILAFNN